MTSHLQSGIDDVHGHHVEFDEWRERCCQTQVPSIFIHFLSDRSDPAAIILIIWKPSIATIAEIFFSAMAAMATIVAIIWKPALKVSSDWFRCVLVISLTFRRCSRNPSPSLAPSCLAHIYKCLHSGVEAE